MATKNVLSLYESKGGIKIDEAKLSAPVMRKIEELNAMLLVLDHLKTEVVGLKKEEGQFRVLFLASLGPAVLGLMLGIAGTVDGVLGALQVSISLLAALGLFGVEFFVLRYRKIALASIVQKNKQIERLSTDLDIRLDQVYDEVLAEQYQAPRPPSFGRRAAPAKQRARRGDETGL